MLVPQEEVIKILKCPKTGVNLVRSSPDYLEGYSENDTYKYKIINDYPIVIDFNNSILSEKIYLNKLASSPIKRNEYNNTITKLIKRIVSPPQKKTAHNVGQICQILQDKEEKRVLIIGGGSIGQGMSPLYQDPEIELIAFDIYISENIQFVADAHQIPLPNNYFDCVIIQAVLEHVLNPHQVVSEIYRVLKNNGIVYSETPFLQQVHEAAYDFTRFTESGHRYLFKNFQLMDSGVIAGPGTQLLWTLDFFVKGFFRSRYMGKICKLLFFWLQYFDHLIPEKYAIDSASTVFFFGCKNNFSVLPKEMVNYYKGSQQ